MKYNKGVLPKVLLIAGIVAALFLLTSVNEGFQGSRVVNLYFKEGATRVAPTFVSSSDPGVTFTSAAVGGTAMLNIAQSLGTLKDFKARGFGTGGWVDIACAKIRGSGSGILSIESGNKVLHKTIALTRSGDTTACPLYTGSDGLKLPQQVSAITIKSLIQGAFTSFKSGGDTSKGGATIHVQLIF